MTDMPVLAYWTDLELSISERCRLKESIADALRSATNYTGLVAIDHVEPRRPTVRDAKPFLHPDDLAD